MQSRSRLKNSIRFIYTILAKGVVTIETGYSGNDFTIDWNKITAIYSGSHFLITLKNRLGVNGSLKTDSVACGLFPGCEIRSAPGLLSKARRYA